MMTNTAKERRIDELVEQFRDRRYEKIERELTERKHNPLHGAALASAVRKRLNEETAEYRKQLEEHRDDDI